MRRLAPLLGACLLACGGLLGAVQVSRSDAASTVSTTVAAVTTSAAAPQTLTSTASSVLAVSGHGWGHGLGMSQWGAYGYAKHGWTYDRILAHYYTGTSLGPAKVATVRVLVAQEKKVVLSTFGSWTVSDATGAKTPLTDASVTLNAKLRLAAAAGAQAPFTFTAAQPIAVDGKPYRGKLVVSADGAKLDVVNSVGLEDYVKGVVPSEMPSGWPPEALKAQAVAARSYALANLQKGKPFDLFADTRSQVYGGVTAQAASTDAAVDATKGQVVLYGGKVADTLFFSTSGGRTASSLESTGVNVPYLVPVADPYDALSPYHDWGPVLLDAGKLAKELHLPGAVTDLEAVNGPSGRVKTVTVSSGEAVATLTGNQARADLGLDSTWFTPALLQLLPTARTITFGGAASLTGVLKGTDGVTLEAKPAGLGWTAAGAVAPDASGRYATIVRPQVSTWYRLAWGSLRAGLAKISVAARVTAAAGPAGVRGTVSPVAAGVPVQLQQQAGGGWTTVAGTTTDSSGLFTLPAPTAAGTYRVRAAPGRGVVAGASPVFTVS